MNKRFFASLVCMVMGMALGPLVMAETAPNRPDMVARMRESVSAIAVEYGNPPFTQIFTNEPDRAAAVRKRFMEFEQMDNLKAQIEALQTKADQLAVEIQAKTAINADLTRKITANQLEIQAARREAAAAPK